MLDSVIRVNIKHYPQILLEECKYEKKKRIKWRILSMMILTQVHLMNLIMNLKCPLRNLWMVNAEFEN